MPSKSVSRLIEALRPVKRRLVSVPILGAMIRLLLRLVRKPENFKTSSSYWDARYRHGGTSGPGSYGRLALFKSEIINQFVDDNNIESVVEFGCGDGAQLNLARYKKYTGIDVSVEAVKRCRRDFSSDKTKAFFVSGSAEEKSVSAELSMSLDVLYHLVEDDVYNAYMHRLVQSAERFICIYSSNVDLPGHVPHIRHRRFTRWIETYAPAWEFLCKIENRFPFDICDPDETSWADFYFFRVRNSRSG